MTAAIHPGSLKRFSLRRTLSNRRMLWATGFSLYPLARIGRALGVRPAAKTARRVAHISPCYFSDKSIIGGGERYAMCLAEAVADKVETTFISFGDKRDSFKMGNLRVEVFPVLSHNAGVLWDPICYSFLSEIARADVIHCHQNQTFVGQLAILAGAMWGKRIFATDLGGSSFHFESRLPISSLMDGYLQISEFATRGLPEGKTQVIYGGVSQEFCEVEPDTSLRTDRRALFVGRQLPHKGINYLIEGLPDNVGLDLTGRVYNEEYSQLLEKLALGKDVRFVRDASDKDLYDRYRKALVTILPSVYKDVYGNEYAKPELLGLVLLESMACGTPVICTDVGAMPEFVHDGVTGFVVPPNDPKALGEKIAYLAENPEAARRMGMKGRELVFQQYTWEAVAGRCIAAYNA